MKITIKNPSSAGSSFTTQTCTVIYQCYKFIQQVTVPMDRFIDFRTEFAKTTETNDNNNRNIFPLLKYAGFIKYDENIIYDAFFTNLGLGFIKVMHLQNYIADNINDELLKRKIEEKLNLIKQNLIGTGLRNILNCNECRYRRELLATIKFLYKYRTIKIEEFAYLIHSLNEDEINFLENMESKLNEYRQGDLVIEVAIDIRSADGSRSEVDISRLTAYGYYIALLNQAGVILKNADNNLEMDDDKIEFVNSLIEE